MTDIQDTGPLDWRIAITDGNGRPTAEFQRRWNTQRDNNALIGTVTFGSGAPTGTPSDGALYVNASADPMILYVGENDQWNIVGVQSFTELSDAPSTYSGQSNSLLRVNSGATGLQFESISGVLDGLGSTQGDILYRNASGWAALTPGASGQFLQTQGSGANPIWAAGGGGGSAGLANLSNNPAISTFTSFVGSPTPTLTQDSFTGGAVMNAGPLAGGDSWKIAYQSAPGVPFTLVARIKSMLPITEYPGFGIVLSDGTGKLTTFFFLLSSDYGEVHVANWNSATSFNTNLVTIGFNPVEYFKVQDDGTNFIFYLSADGSNWMEYFSVARNSFLAAPATLIGWGINTNSGVSITNWNCLANLVYWKITTP